MGEKIESLRRFLGGNGNHSCADCRSHHVKFASLTHGPILCSRCANVHQKMGSDIKGISEDKLTISIWNSDVVDKLLSKRGNRYINEILEKELPPYYRRPWPAETCPDFLCEVFVKAKYIHQEFREGATDRNAQCQFTSHEKSGYLSKKLRDADTFCDRFFELSVERNFLRYFVKVTDNEPKETIDLEKLNASFVDPVEFGVPPHTLLIQCVQDSSTRHIFIRSEESRVIVDWYNSIRMGKYHRLCLNYACMGIKLSHEEIAQQLTRDLDVAGWLEKTGPRKKDAWRKRWCMLFQRHLLYMDKPLSAFSKGELYISCQNNGFSVQKGTPDDWKQHTGYAFTIFTKTRPFVFVCGTKEEQIRWISLIEELINAPLTLEESKRAAKIIQK